MPTISRRAEVRARVVFVESPTHGMRSDEPRYGMKVNACVFEASADGRRLVKIDDEVPGSDTVNKTVLSLSSDGGATWGESRLLTEATLVAGGTWRSHHTGCFYDASTDRLLTIWNEAILPTDKSSEAIDRMHLTYSVSTDGGLTDGPRLPIVHEGAEYSPEHPMPGVWIGRNSFSRGDLGCRPLRRDDGAILVPAQVTPLGPDGERFDPHGTVKYRDSVLLIGRWQADGTLAWTTSQRIVADPAQTTRGVLEPTIAFLADGRLMMVMRGSNAKHPDLPARRWIAYSADGGETWTAPAVWTYDTGEAFFSPSSCSQLLPTRDGRLYWLGNIRPENPVGNGPRYPFVLGEVCTRTGRLIYDTCCIVDDREEHENPSLNLSNFLAREDPDTGEILLYMTRLFADYPVRDGVRDWTADALLYRIARP